MNSWSDEETDNRHYADRRNFYKVEKWSRDGLQVELMVYAGNNLEKARGVFERTTKQRPRIPADHSSAHACARRVAAARNDPMKRPGEVARAARAVVRAGGCRSNSQLVEALNRREQRDPKRRRLTWPHNQAPGFFLSRIHAKVVKLF
jgi:hypothetical protein